MSRITIEPASIFHRAADCREVLAFLQKPLASTVRDRIQHLVLCSCQISLSGGRLGRHGQTILSEAISHVVAYSGALCRVGYGADALGLHNMLGGFCMCPIRGVKMCDVRSVDIHQIGLIVE